MITRKTKNSVELRELDAMSSASVFGSFYHEVVSSKNKAATLTNLRIKQNSYSTRAFQASKSEPSDLILEGVVSGTYLNCIRQS